VLRACRDLLKPGGRLAFTTIFITPGVSRRDYLRASRARGPGAASRRETAELLDAAGFCDVHERDVTKAFARATRAYLETSARYATELRSEWGEAKFDEAQRDRATTLVLVRDGVLRRGMFTARRPSTSVSMSAGRAST
jgi:hypothetical protein